MAVAFDGNSFGRVGHSVVHCSGGYFHVDRASANPTEANRFVELVGGRLGSRHNMAPDLVSAIGDSLVNIFG